MNQLAHKPQNKIAPPREALGTNPRAKLFAGTANHHLAERPGSAAVVSASTLLLQRCACGGTCPACEKKKKLMQRSAADGNSVSAIPTAVHRVLSSPGRPLDFATQQFMEPRFGHDFNQVRVHDGPGAAASARAVAAKAYTVGQDVVFGAGHYAPHSPAGRQLLAHELTHTIQQRGLQRSSSGVSIPSSAEDQRYESEAESVARSVMSGSHAPAAISPSARPLLSRQVTRPWGEFESPLDYSITARGLGTVTFHVWGRSDSPDTDKQSGQPKAVAFRIDKFFLPTVKANVRPTYENLAKAGVLEATIRVDRGIAPVTQGRDSNLRKLWCQKHSWATDRAGDLWHAAGGDPQANATEVAPGISSPHFPFIAKESCDVDHIVELQTMGTNLPANLQMLNHAPNLLSGWDAIWPALRGLASQIRGDLLGKARPDIILHFDEVALAGPTTPEHTPGDCSTVDCDEVSNGRAKSCWQVECCAKHALSLVTGTATASVPKGRAYPIKTPGKEAKIFAPPRPREELLERGELNGPACDILAGLSMTKLKLGAVSDAISGKKDNLEAVIDAGKGSRRGARTGAALKELTPGAIVHVTRATSGDEGVLAFLNPVEAIRFQYPGMSDVRLNLTLCNDQVHGTGTLTPSIPLLQSVPMHLDFNPERLHAEVRADPRKLRSPFPGFTFTEFSFGADLLPEFDPSGGIGFKVGPAQREFLTGFLKATLDENYGLLLAGDIFAHIPGTDRAQGHLEYRDRQWAGFVVVNSSQIHLPGFQRGELRIDFNPDGTVRPSGTVELLVAGNPVTLRAIYENGRLLLSGDANVRVPGLQPVVLALRHNGEHLAGSARTGVVIGGLTGNVLVNYQDGRVSGEGTVNLERGRASGTITLHLSEAGNLFGQGSATVRLTDNLAGTVGIAKPEEGPVRVSGQLRFPNPIQLFRAIERSHTLFERTQEFPIPGLSIPVVDAGVIATLTGRLSASYGFGPGTLEDIRTATAFNPLEEDAKLEVDADATLSVPAYANLSLSLRAGAGVSAAVANVTVGITGTGTAGLRGGFTGAVRFHYGNAVYVVDAEAAIRMRPEFSLGLDSDVTAELGAYGYSAARWQKIWNLATYRWGADVEAGLIANLHYASNEGLTLPSPENIRWIVPPIDPPKVLGDLFRAAPATEKNLP